jgi:hypothetical protein
MFASSLQRRPVAACLLLVLSLGCVGIVDEAGQQGTGLSPAGGASTGVGADGGSSYPVVDASPGSRDTVTIGGPGAGSSGAGGAIDAGSLTSGGGVATDGAIGADRPAQGAAENSDGDCPVPKLAAASQLSPYAKHPDPFKMLDGSRITQKAQWRCRRAEIKAQVQEYESGPKPIVAPEAVRAQWSGDSLTISVSNEQQSVQFSVNISRPAGAGSNAIPAVIAFGFMTLDGSVFSQNGVATITFNQDALGAQSGGASRGTGRFYDLYGRDHAASSMVAWAWGVSRIIDALEQTPQANIDPQRVAVTGCSRNGKGALLAGALDERIVLTIPQESGAGGSASWRVSQAQSVRGVNVQTLSSAAGEQPWFRANFAQAFGGDNVTKLPFDHHMVMGLVAPRALLVIDNAIDWLGIDSTFTAGSIAHTIWDALGRGDQMGYWQTGGHAHCQFPAQQRAILDAYVKKFLAGDGSADTRMLRADGAKADLSAWMDWMPPTLQ